MSEMVERVAKAITSEFEAGRRVFDEGEAEDLARAAIEAMREPTQEMVNAADPHGIIVANFETAWQAMIDTALK